MKMLHTEGGVVEPIIIEGHYSTPTTDTLDISAAHLIFGYLTQNCYGEAASAFLSQWLGPHAAAAAATTTAVATTTSGKVENSQRLLPLELFALQTLQYRQRLLSLLLEGKISEAIEYIEQFFPQILHDDNMQDDDDGDDDGVDTGGKVGTSWLKFRLLCQHFVEMVRRGDSTAALEFTEAKLAPMAQNRPLLLQHLQEVVVLLAYSDPAESPVKHLLALSHREELANHLNAAILKRRESTLETILRQLILLNTTNPEGGKVSSSSSTEQLDLASFLCDLVSV